VTQRHHRQRITHKQRLSACLLHQAAESGIQAGQQRIGCPACWRSIEITRGRIGTTGTGLLMSGLPIIASFGPMRRDAQILRQTGRGSHTGLLQRRRLRVTPFCNLADFQGR